jgi:hypothetical protein
MRLRGTFFDISGVEAYSIDTLGHPPSCRQIAQNNLGSSLMVLAGQSLAFDSGLGDQLTNNRLVCQGPGYDLGP